MRDAIYNRIEIILSEQLNIKPQNIVIDASITSDLEIDSINYVELILAIATEFDIEITDEDENGISTVNDIVKLVEQKIETSDMED